MARFFDDLINAKSDKLRLDIIEGLPQWPVIHALRVESTETELTTALRSMANAKAVGAEKLPSRTSQARAEPSPDRTPGVPPGDEAGVAPTEDTAAVARYGDKKKDRTEGESYRGGSLVAQAGKVLLKTVLQNSAPTAWLRNCCPRSSAGSARTARRRI